MITPSEEKSKTPPALATEGESSLAHAVDSFAARVRAASASFRQGATDQAARLKQEAKDHPIETVTGAFGLGYLVGKALFKRKPK